MTDDPRLGSIVFEICTMVILTGRIGGGLLNYFRDNLIGIFIFSVSASLVAAFLYGWLTTEKPPPVRATSSPIQQSTAGTATRPHSAEPDNQTRHPNTELPSESNVHSSGTHSPVPENVPVAPTLRETAPTSWPTMSVISIEDLDAPDETKIPFPTEYFRDRLREELGPGSTSIREIRLGIAFIEPQQTRPLASGGTIIGYLLVSLPTVPECTRRFGGQAYNFPAAATGIMKAVNDQAPAIANWVRRASQGETLTCPDY